MNNFVGISGRQNSGKSTVARMLWEAMGGFYNNVYVINFGDPVKWRVRRIYDPEREIPLEWFYTQEGKKQYLPTSDLTIREALIKEGEGQREDNANYWVDQIHKVIERNPDCFFIVADIRMKHEYMWATILKAPIFRIERPDAVHPQDEVISLVKEDELANVVFEAKDTSGQLCSTTIHNTTTITELKYNITIAMHQFGLKEGGLHKVAASKLRYGYLSDAKFIRENWIRLKKRTSK